MRDLERLLTGAYPEGLRDVPPAPVRKSAVRDKTFEKLGFYPADILLPKDQDMTKWAVVACDQFTSDQAYWDRVRKNAEGAVSTINLILPEAELGTEKEAAHTAEINATMKKYMEDGVFTEYPNSFIYVERTLENGSIREGLVGMVDLANFCEQLNRSVIPPGVLGYSVL